MIYIILLIGLFFRSISLNQSFWLDETIQAFWSNKTLSELPIAQDFHPPFFYIFTHYWQTYQIYTEWFLRIPSVIFGLLTIYYLFFFLKKNYDNKTAIVASIFLSTSAYHIYYSQEYRMYSFFCLLVLLSWIFLHENKLAKYALVTLISIFTNYFAFIVIFSQLIWVLFFKKEILKKILIICSGIFVSFLFFLPTFLIQIKTAQKLLLTYPKWGEVSGSSFTKFPGLLLAKFTVGMTSFDNKYIYAIIVFIMIFIFLISILKTLKKKITNIDALFLIYFFTPFFIAWISSFWTAINGPWRLLFILPAFYTIIAIGLKNTKNNICKIIISITLIINVFFSLKYLLLEKFHRENWREAVKYSDSFLNKNTITLSSFSGPFTSILWYSKYPENNLGNTDLNKILNYKKIILFTYLNDIFDNQRATESFLKKNTYSLTQEKDFKGVGIIKIYSK